jgi:hypothetical protein
MESNKRYGTNPKYEEKKKAQAKKYYQTHREKRLAYQKAYYEKIMADPVSRARRALRQKAYSKTYYKRIKDKPEYKQKVKARSKRYYRAHKEAVIARQQAANQERQQQQS